MHLLSQIDPTGVQFRLRGQEFLIGPPSRVTPATRSLVTEHRNEIWQHLTAPNTEQALTVELGGQRLPYRFWDGEHLSGDTLALDTETRLIEGDEVPELAMVQASNGQDHVIIHPARVNQFLQLHFDRHYVCHHVGFDFWVLDKHLSQAGRVVLWTAADQGRIHDTMLLDALVRIATRDGLTPSGQLKLRRNLGELAGELLHVRLAKDDPYRLRYGETIGQDWRMLEPGFFQYAIKDAIVTYHVFVKLQQQAAAIAKQHKIAPDLIGRYGHLTETLQVKAAICLAAITRRGLQVDLVEARNVHQRLKDHVDSMVASLDGFGLFKRKKDGQLQYTENGAPRKHDSVLQQQLKQIEQRLGITAPRTAKTAKIGKSTKFWKAYSKEHSFLTAWIGLEDSCKLLQFLGNLTTERIHPQYETLVRTGRTSCHSPNLQQLPKADGFRELIVASPGYVLLQADYSQIELRTFAAICLQRYGFSTLAEVIAKGIDPHVFTAALFRGDTLVQFKELQQTDPEQYKALRQRAKALNFGVPGGLGPASLIVYARASYGVDLTFEEGRAFRQKLIREVYPEMGVYLREDTASILADRLRTSRDVVVHSFPDQQLFQASKALANGTADESVFETLLALNNNPDLAALLNTRDPTVRVQLLWNHTETLTGRVRGPVPFTAARNTPFQGLACDGAKLALWELLKAGYRVVGFIHDEVLIELPEHGNCAEAARRIDQILCQSMQQLTGTVPIECEWSVADRWTKRATQVRDQDGNLLIWTPNGPVPPGSVRHRILNGPAVAAKSEAPSAECGSHTEIVSGEKRSDRQDKRRLAHSPSVAVRSSVQPDSPCSPSDAKVPKRIAECCSREKSKPAYSLDDPTSEIYIGDCRDVLCQLGERPELIFADPPFNIGEEYGLWKDNLPWNEYVQFTYSWIDCCLDVLATHGSIWIHVPDEIVAETIMHLKGQGLTMRRKGIWHFRFGQCNDSSFIRSHENWVYFVKDPNNFRWNSGDILVDSDRATKYGDKRTKTTKTPGKRVPFDVFGIPSDGPYWGRVQGNNAERRPRHENQLPEVYLARVIKALSNPGDLIIDPFAGSGTTATVARALGRRCITIEFDPDNAASAFDRIQNGPVRDVGQHATSS